MRSSIKTILLIYVAIIMHFNYPTLAFQIAQIDSNYLSSLFEKASPQANNNNNNNNFMYLSVLKQSVEQQQQSDDQQIQFASFFEEQCQIECLRNFLCIKYFYSESKFLCTIFLNRSLSIRRSVAPSLNNNNAKLANILNCDLSKCNSKSTIYCSPNRLLKTASQIGTCFYDVKKLQTAAYDLASEWSEWSACSTLCNEGLRMRRRKCYLNYGAWSSMLLNDASQNSRIETETIENDDWLCNQTNDTSKWEKFQLNACNSNNKCGLYAQWSEWSSSSSSLSSCDANLCGSMRQRTRSCSNANANKNDLDCNSAYLNQNQMCSSFSSSVQSCASLITVISKRDSSQSSNSDILKKGSLKLINQSKNNANNNNNNNREEIKLLLPQEQANENDKSLLNRISQVACNEMGFNSSVRTSPLKLQSAANTNAYFISCDGTESSIRDCKLWSNNKTLSNESGNNNDNGYWSSWSSWTACSVTCGAGAKTRQRLCNDPSPSLSDTNSNNGKNCASSATDFANCIMPRCKN